LTSTFDAVLRLLDECLGLGGRAQQFDVHTALLGALPEFDSMAAASVLTGLEETFGFSIDDDEVDGSIFESVGSLVAFVDRKLG
jgi:acyl carrier protein